MREIGPHIIGFAAVVMIFGIPIVGIICHFAYETVKAWAEIGLKRDMVARGYTAQEIIEVLAANKDTETKTKLPDVPPAKPVKHPVYSS
jgi:hypothetical protein